ncbi:PepSY-associated TM helix domain-containing protein [Thermaurantiacus sp.]
MRTAIDAVHRWAGGVLGLALALLGLSGALLLWKSWWIGLPGARPGLLPDRGQVEAMIAAAEELEARHLLLPSDGFGLAEVRLGGGAGAYLAPDGQVVSAWASRWARPELWLFDLHHELLAGEAGHTLVGLLGIAGLAFVATGLVLWWPSRRHFRPRPLPGRLTRPQILRHHRDLGAAIAPLLLLLFLTGAMLALRPFAAFLLAPLSRPSEVEAWLQPPPPPPPAATARNWPEILAAAEDAFPDGQLRIVSWPKRPGDHLVLRLRQPAEWHANGRTTLWFAPGGTRPVQVRDALAAPAAVRAFNLVWPVHTGRVGGLPLRLLLTLAGLALTLLGALAMASFWSGGGLLRGRRGPR